MFIDKITSKDNPKIKEILQLQEKSKERREKGCFVVEGIREITHCIEGGFPLESIFFCNELIPEEKVLAIASSLADSPSLFALGRNVYEKIAYRGSTEGMIALAKGKPRSLKDIAVGRSPLVLIFEGVEKPGNLGAVLRTADAAGVDAVLICEALTDLFNPNLIRASLGGVFTLQVAECSSGDALAWLRGGNFTILSAQLQDSKPYYDIDMTGPTAIVFGAESTGLTPFWRKEASSHIMIPMLGKLDSLNVSVSAAVLCYEALRQRESLK